MKKCGSNKIPTFISSGQTLDNFWTISGKFRTNFGQIFAAPKSSEEEIGLKLENQKTIFHPFFWFPFQPFFIFLMMCLRFISFHFIWSRKSKLNGFCAQQEMRCYFKSTFISIQLYHIQTQVNWYIHCMENFHLLVAPI